MLNPVKRKRPAGSGSARKKGRRKVFISYRRSESTSKTLAEAIRRSLDDAGHQVFIDTAMAVGTNWVDEIAARINWCDYLVVLLSEESCTSEMVQGEVRLAHQRRKREKNQPEILPIRVAYTGPLDYELDSYIGRLQHILWTDPAETEDVVAQIAGRVAGEAPREREPAPHPEPVRDRPDLKRPQPKVDPRQLSAPDGYLPDDDPFYILRPADERVANIAASKRGETLVIKAPPKMGKSSILVRYLAECQRQGKKICLSDFGNFADAELDHLPTLLREIANTFGEPFGVKPPPDLAFNVPRDLTTFLQGSILPAVSEPVVFAFDEVDRILGKPYQSDFFTMLRMWHENRGKDLRGRWKCVGLALVISTEPYLLIDAEDRSPFNVTTPVEPDHFDVERCGILNERYGAGLAEPEVEELHELLSGHPYLVRLGLYRVVTKDIVTSFREMVNRSADYNGPFGEHLRALLLRLRLRDKHDLVGAMRRLTKTQEPPTQEIGDRLRGAGLVRIDKDNRVVPANLVYARFFKGNL